MRYQGETDFWRAWQCPIVASLIVIAALTVGCGFDPSGEKSAEKKEPSLLPKDADFSQLVDVFRELAARTTHEEEGDIMTVRVLGSDAEEGSISLALDNKELRSTSTALAVVYWQKKEGVWRFKNMTSDWQDLGMLGIITEQQLVNQICRSLDDQFVPPRGTPEQDAEAWREIQPLIEEAARKAQKNDNN